MAVFDETYLEILGHEAGAVQREQSLVHRRRGLMGLVFKPPLPAARLKAGLDAAGVATGAASRFSRPATLEDGRVERASFDLLFMPDGITDDGVVFFCGHETPQWIWRPAWQRHRNGVVGVRTLVVSAQDPRAAAASYRPLFGAPSDGEACDVRFDVGPSTLRFLRPERILEAFGNNPHDRPRLRDQMVVLVFKVRDLAATAGVLRDSGVPGIRVTPDRVTVPADQAFGAVLVFEA